MLRIAGGRVYDPANGVAGEVRDVCVQDGKIVADVPGHARRIDARGMVVMPGGVDIHAHIAGPGGQRRAQALARGAPRRRPRPHRDRALRHRGDRPLDVRHGLPLRAAGLHDRRRGRHAAARGPPHALGASRHAGHRRRLPRADGQQPAALRAHPLEDPLACATRSRGTCRSTGGYGVKLVNPGGVEMWKRGNGNVTSLDDEGPGVTPRSVIETIATAVHELGLPHPVHVHCNNLGVPGNWRTTLDTLRHARGPPRPSRPPAVPRLRRAAGRAAAVTGAGARRAPERAPGAQRRRRAGDVRPGDDDDRRRAGLRRPARDHPRPLGQRRHRGRDRLRDRPVHLPRAQLRPRAAVGDRPRAVPAQPGPVAARPVHRPPQRRLVPQLPAADPPAHGSRVPQRADPAGEPAGDEAHRPARRPRSRVHARGDRDHHARRAGATARAARQGPPRSSAPTPTSRSTTTATTARRCSPRRAT